MDCTSHSDERALPARESFNALTHVPPEIFHCVFELLSKDKPTLSSCTYVSRHYRELAIPWLFAQITVHSAERLTSFLEFADTNPDLGALVKQLHFYDRISSAYTPILHPQHTIRSLVSSVISAFPSLQSLLLCGVRLAAEADPAWTLPPAGVDLAPQSNRHLPKLWISNVGKTSWASILIWFLSRYTVDTLHLTGVRIPPLNDSGSNIASALAHLRNSVGVRRLVVNVCPTETNDPYSLLEALLQPGSVQTLYLLCKTFPSATRILRFMRSVGGNVTRVCLDIARLAVENESPGKFLAAVPLALRSTPIDP